MGSRDRPRVLVVDDSKDTANSMALLLRAWGFEAKACYDGAAALETARVFRPHIVLLDIGMPHMDGFQLAHRLHEQAGSRHAELIAITGHTSEICLSRAGEIDFLRYLTKPVDPNYLSELLARMVERAGFWEAVSADDEGALRRSATVVPR